MLALAAVNGLAALTFAAMYVAAGARLLGHAAFGAGLLVAFAGLVALWWHVEGSRPGGRDAASRVGRIAVGFALVAVAFPPLVLMPLFALRDQLPPEAGLDHLLPGTMVAALVALALTAGVNAAGIAIALGAAVARRLRRRG